MTATVVAVVIVVVTVPVVFLCPPEKFGIVPHIIQGPFFPHPF
jgi:hypothetical protein